MPDLVGGGYHWQTKEFADRWPERQKATAGEREDAFEKLLAELPANTSSPLSVIDIGAGDGKVTSLVLDRYPGATAVLVDFSEPMMDRGKELLSRFVGRFRYVFWDMNEGDWPRELDGPFDAAVSAAAIHHLVNDRKAWLGQQILGRLVPGGVFANYDLFRKPDAVIPEDDVHTLTCATIEEARELLAGAGYAHVSVDRLADRPKGIGALMVGRKRRVDEDRPHTAQDPG